MFDVPCALLLAVTGSAPLLYGRMSRVASSGSRCVCYAFWRCRAFPCDYRRSHRGGLYIWYYGRYSYVEQNVIISLNWAARGCTHILSKLCLRKYMHVSQKNMIVAGSLSRERTKLTNYSMKQKGASIYSGLWFTSFNEMLHMYIDRYVRVLWRENGITLWCSFTLENPAFCAGEPNP